jgi:glycosyltransferase involved in cell wall biosynthesis
MDVTALHQGQPRSPVPVVDIVVPVHNEQADLARSVRRLERYLRDRFPFPAAITIADNASTDGTWAIAQALERELCGVRAIRLPRKGRGGALATAWLASDAPVVAYMDVDLSTDLDALLPLVAPLISGHSDVSIGSRLSPGARVVRGARREVISRAYNLLLRLTLRVRFRDAQCGFKAVRADVARQLVPRVENRSWFFDTELLVLAERAGFRIHEVAVDWVDDSDSRVAVVPTAIEDLRGLARVSRRLLSGEALAGLSGRTPRPPARRMMGQVASFGVIGVACTAAYALLFSLLRPIAPAVVANLVALVLTTVVNTAANRRFTFGVQGRAGLAGDHAGGLVALGLGLVATNLALAALAAVHPDPSPTAELATLMLAGAMATLVRFLLLRALILDRRRVRVPVPVVEVPRRRS